MNNTSANFGKAVFLVLLVLLSCTAGYVNAQQQTVVITGVVLDAATKKPVPAAQISVVNNKISATAGENGEFTLKLNSEKSLLLVKAYGYNDREVALRGQASVTVMLYPDAFSIWNDYIHTDQLTVPGSVLTSAAKSINNLSKNTSLTADELIQNALSADVRGITRSGVTGIGSNLFMRGFNSLYSNSQPLFVVDGVIWNTMYDVNSIHDGFFNNVLNNLQASDIENIAVLKDGTSMYGSKGSNGVILINTKRASDMVTKINVNVMTGFTSAPKTMPLMDAAQYKVYLTEMIGTTGLTNAQIEQLPYLNDNPARSTYKWYHNNTNWNDQVYQTGFTQDYSINVRGGDEKAKYYFSLGYTGNDGVVKKTDFQKYNLRLNADISLSDKIDMGLTTGFSRMDRSLTDDGINQISSPTWLSKIKAPILNPTNYTSLGDPTTEFTYYDVFGIGNPGGLLQYSINTVETDNFSVGLKPVYRISSSLTVSEKFDYSINKINEDYYRPYLYSAPMFVEGLGYSFNARMKQVMRDNSIFSDTRVNFEKQFGLLNKLNMFAGLRYMYDSYEMDYIEGHNSYSNSSINLVGSFDHLFATGDNNDVKSMSYYVNADFNFNRLWLLNVAASVDASSRFGKETKGGFQTFGHSWAFFPSVNAAWLMSSEKFMKNLTWINLLKLRGGFSITGNDDIADYQTQTYFSTIRFKGVGNGLVLSTLANPEIQWETTGTFNAGLDMTLFNERLGINFDVYSKATTNLLILKQYEDVAGLGAYWTNSGTLGNVGYELNAQLKAVNTTGFKWEIAAGIGGYENMIVDLPDGEMITNMYDAQILSTVGQSAGVFYGYKTLGVFSTSEEAQASGLKMTDAKGNLVAFGAGDVHFVDTNSDGLISEDDKQIIGDPNPDFYGSITNTFTVKNLTLSALITYSSGNDIYNVQRRLLESGIDASNQTTAMLTRWTAQNQITGQPRIVYGDPMGNARFSDRWIEDGSYMRLKNVTLSYRLPVKSTFIEGADVWVSANNLFTLTNYLGPDPEVSAGTSVLMQGIDAGLLPLSRTYMVGIKLRL